MCHGGYEHKELFELEILLFRTVGSDDNTLRDKDFSSIREFCRYYVCQLHNKCTSFIQLSIILGQNSVLSALDGKD